jgi:hypothetical protein
MLNSVFTGEITKKKYAILNMRYHDEAIVSGNCR